MANMFKFGFVWCIAVASLLAIPFVYADNYETHAPATSATINSFVDTSISPASIAFGNLNPATFNNSMTGGNITVTNTVNSNTAIDSYLRATNLTSNGDIIEVSNLTVSHTDNGTKTLLVETGWLDGTGANQGYVEDVARGGTFPLWFYLDVPAGQAAGTYTGTVTIKNVANATAP